MVHKSLRELSDEEKDLIRQGERTVDNLKRLFAVVFATSFAFAGASIADKARPVVVGSAAFPSWEAILIDTEMAAVFAVTAAVFYHQSAKFLDIRYGRHPLAIAHPLGFALDYGTLVLTAAPFFFMAQALSPTITDQVGYFPFFSAYVVLFIFGLCLLGMQSIRHSKWVRLRAFGESIPEAELAREGKLRQFWLLMNSAMLLILLLVFGIATWFATCPPAPRPGEPVWFLYAFGAVAVARDALDYSYSWRFIYPLPPSVSDQKQPWPLSVIIEAKQPWIWSALGYLLVLMCVIMIIWLQLWNAPYWLQVCR